MRHKVAFSFVTAATVVALSFSATQANNNRQHDNKSPTQNRQPTRPGNQTGQRPAVRPPVSRNPIRPPVNQPVRQQPNPVRNPPSQRPPVRPPVRPYQGGSARGEASFHPRPGQQIINPNRNWVPNVGHRFNTSIYLSINIWNRATFGNQQHVYDWDPSVWRYSVEDSLMDLVYVSERTSNTLRTSFELQVSQDNQTELSGVKMALDRIQRMDESFQRLRSETGSVSEAEMQTSVVESLALAQQVSRSFSRHPNLLQLVRYEWSDCLFEFNELARYYGEPGIQ